MAFQIKDRVLETSITTGTGTLTLAGAIAGYRTFLSALTDADTCYYGIEAVDANGVPTGDWEVGVGTYSASTLARAVIYSNNANALVNLAAGTKRVFITSVSDYGNPLVVITTANRAIQVANDTALGGTAGNARGKGAVDLQMKRISYATAVASGSYSVVSGGSTNTASGPNGTVSGGAYNKANSTNASCGGGQSNVITAAGGTISGGRLNAVSVAYGTVAGGKSNTASGSHSAVMGGNNNTASASQAICGGYNNTASAPRSAILCGMGNIASTNNYATVLNGKSNTASGNSSICSGSYAAANKHSQLAHAAGSFVAQGDAQISTFVLRISTTTATAAEMFLNGSFARMDLANNSTWHFKIQIIAWRTDIKTTGAGWFFSGVIQRAASAGATVILGTITTLSTHQNAGATTWVIAITADTANGSLKITVTGEAAKTIQWVARVETVETTG